MSTKTAGPPRWPHRMIATAARAVPGLLPAVPGLLVDYSDIARANQNPAPAVFKQLAAVLGAPISN